MFTHLTVEIISKYSTFDSLDGLKASVPNDLEGVVHFQKMMGSLISRHMEEKNENITQIKEREDR